LGDGPGWHYGGWYGFLPTNEEPNLTIYPSQLALDVYDSKNHRLIWSGDVGNAIDSAVVLAVQGKTLHIMVTKLLKKYPLPP